MLNFPSGGNSGYQGLPGKNKVLTVDDEEVIRFLLRDALSDEFAMALVESGEAAIPFLINDPPDVMVVDKNLPGISGVELLQQAKTIQPETEVIIVTGYASLESAIEALRLGAYDYLIKPFADINIVIEKIRRACEKKELTAERRKLMEQVLAANQELRAAHDRLRRGYLQTLSGMITALEARDPYTRGHSDRVAEYTLMIGKELGLIGECLSNLVDGARLHDLGKIGIQEQILNKLGKLTEEEYRHIQTHSNIGAEIIGKMEAYQHLVPMIKHHHERMDGRGYPDGLKGNEIPLEARIIAVADTFDAMTSERPYRRTLSSGKAAVQLRKLAGHGLDPSVVKVFFIVQNRLDSELASSL